MSESVDSQSCHLSLRGIRLVMASLVCLASGVCSANRARGQSLDDPVLAAWASFPATYACRQCHYESEPVGNLRFDDPTQLKRGDLSRQNEMYRWVRDDKHAIARLRVEPLRADEIEAEQRQVASAFDFGDGVGAAAWVGPSNLLSRRICDALGIDVDRPQGYQRFAESCLSCHGGYDSSAGPQPGFEKPQSLARSQPGISCLSCHQQFNGSGATSSAWVLTHASLQDPQERSWRELTPEQKAAQGMRDIQSVSKQTDLCLDCHVGNLRRGMFVDHAMYAAGHPPLPNFEIETFVGAMPPHWRSEAEQWSAFEEAGYPKAEKYFAVNYPGLSSRLSAGGEAWTDVAWDTRRALIGAAAVLRRGAETIVLAAESEGREAGSLWGDYALYDCAACHHELRRPSLRQQRGYPGAPGRPRLHEWPDIVLQTVAPASFAAGAQQRLVQAVTAVPFGNPVDCRDAAAELLTALDASVNRIESDLVVRRQLAWLLIERISAVDRDALVDYATARQVVWSILVAAEELATFPDLSPEESARLRRIEAELARWGAPAEARAGGRVLTGSIGIATALPAGRDRFIFRENLAEELRRRADYQPDALAESLHRLRLALDAPSR